MPAILTGQPLPHNWQVISVKWLSRRYSGGTPDKNISYYWTDGTIPWLNSGSVNQGVIREPSEFITEEGFSNSSAKWMPRGSLVMALAGQGKTKAMVGYLDIETTGNQSLAAIVPNAIDGKFLYWWLTSQYRHIRNLSSQDGRDGLNLEMVGSIRCPVPPVQTQKRIAAFLDEKTAQVDTLIAKKQALLERLAEKRQAIITRAVTKGLNPAAPMKDSGIDWLGQIPAHWEVIALNKVTTKITNGYVGPTRDLFVDEGVRYLQSLHIKGNRIVFGNDFFVEKEWSDQHAKSILKMGDVLVVQTGDIGQVACVPAEYEGCNCHALIICSPVTERLDGRYLAWLFNSDYGQEFLHMVKTGALHPHLNCGNVKFFNVLIPPLAEQREIADFVDQQRIKLEEMTAKVTMSMGRLQEYRSALITAAVTGQKEV